MAVPPGFIDIMLLLGALHGFALGAALLLRTSGRRANRWLGVLILVFAFDMGTLYLLRTAGPERFPHLVGLTDPLTFLYGPMIYLYVRTLVSGRDVRRRDFVHLLPAIAATAAVLPLLSGGVDHKITHWQRACAHAGDSGTDLRVALTLLTALAYLAWSYVLVRRHAGSVRDRFSDLEHRDLRWLRLLLGTVLAIWLVSLVFFLTRNMGGQHGGIVFSIVTVLFYFIGFLALRQPEIFSDTPASAEPADAPSPIKYGKSRLDDDRASDIRRRLEAHLASAHPHRRSGLTLQELAADLDVSPHSLSQVINEQLGRNFHDLINERRVEEVRRRLDDPANAHLTLLAVALDAGFRSKSTFNSIFKKITGLTPSQYRDRRPDS